MRTTKQRLESYRAKAAECQGRGHLANWKYWKRHIWSTRDNARGPDGQIYSESLEQYGDNLGDAHELDRGMKHTGWYADNWHDDLMRGAVCKMRTSRGIYYIPATYCTGWDGTIHYMNDAVLVSKGGDEYDHDQAIREAARSADHWAEREADEAREYHAKDQAEQKIEAAREEIHDINQRALALIREIKAAGKSYTPAVCDAIRATLQGAVDKRRRAFRRIDRFTDNPWAAVE